MPDLYLEIIDVRSEGLAEADYSDAQVKAAILTWQAFLIRACRQWFSPVEVTFLVDGNDSGTLHFGVPIISIEYLKINTSTDSLDSEYYKVYNDNAMPDDRKNPKISLIRSSETRDIYTRPLTSGALKFRKGRKNQHIKGYFGYIDSAVPASGAIQFVAKADLIDGQTFVLDDGVNTAVTFYFDVTGTYVPVGGYDATNVRVNVSGATTADDVAAIAKTAISAATSLDITPGLVETGGLLKLENDLAGTTGNIAITETVANVDFKVYGMSKGGVPYMIQRAMLKLVIEKLTATLYSSSGSVPSTSLLGYILSEETDGHKISYGYSGSDVQDRRPGLSGITQDQEVLDIIKLYKAPIGIATPADWSYD